MRKIVNSTTSRATRADGTEDLQGQQKYINQFNRYLFLHSTRTTTNDLNRSNMWYRCKTKPNGSNTNQCTSYIIIIIIIILNLVRVSHRQLH